MLNDIQVSTLANGLTVLSAADPLAESVSAGIWVRAGGRCESAQESGYSHFLEHMLFKGTPSRTPLEITRAIEGRGGYLNAYTQEESTCYYFRLPCEYMREGVGVLADMYRNSLLNDDEIEREREVILEEIKMYQDLPHHLVQEKLQEAMFRQHALGRPLAGTEQTLQAVDHGVLSRFKEECYRPGATVMAFAGRIAHDDCVACVEEHLGGMAPGRGRSFEALDAAQGQEALTATGREIGQVHAVLGFRIFGRHDRRRYALRMLNGILGENMSSRLFQSVREQHGLCYSIQSGYQFFDDAGIFSISGGFDEHRAHAALELTAGELTLLLEKGVTPDEMERTRDYLLGTFRLGLESTGSKMSYLGESYINYGAALSPQTVIDGIRSVQLEEVQELAAEILTREFMTLAVVAPPELSRDEERWLDSVSFGC
jgi:predicted Zn-dependent peptidase